MTPFEKEIESLVDTILVDYKNDRDIDKLELHRQPDKDVVIDIIEKLRRIVFPAILKIRPIGCITLSTTCPCSLRM